MSAVGGLGGSAASYYAQALQQLEQRLFSKIDANGDGSVTKAELEQAVGQAGGTTASADALYAALDPNNTGSVSAQQFAQNLPLPVFSPDMGAQLITAQAQTSGTGSDPAASFKANLFTQLDANGDGTLTKSELEKAVTAAGGTTAAADALYAELDPNNTGSVSEQQFIQNLPAPHHHHHHGGDATQSASTNGNTTSTDGGNSAQDALMALIDSLLQPAGTSTASTSDGSSTGSTTTNAATSATANNSAEAALLDLIDNLDPSSQRAGAGTSSTSTSGNSADDALLALLNADGTGTSTTAATTATAANSTSDSSTSTDSSPASLFAKFNQQILALMLQLQTQSFAA